MAATGNQSLVEKKISEHKKQEAWFEQRVREYEKLVATNPKGYRLRVRLFGWIGYLYIVFILFVLLLVLALVVLGIIYGHSAAMAKLAIFAVIIIAAIVRSLWVKIEMPKGVELTRDQAPRLWLEVDRIAEAIDADHPNHIILNTELNAAAFQRPRLGIFGFYENVLLLGMPLLLTLSPDEARSVIAHEYGHFSGQHGRFGAWAYRVNQTWYQLRENIAQTGGKGAWLFVNFVKWFSPRFAAMTFALRRQHEYEADQAAAQISSPQTAATALMRLSYLGEHVSKSFWTPFYDQVKELPQPPVHAFAAMPSSLAAQTPPEDIAPKLGAALKAQTDYDDTHPCLTDRLRAMNQLPTDVEQTSEKLSAPVGKSAAEEFFGTGLQAVLDRIEAEHLKRITPAWAKEHARRAESQRTLDELEKVAEPTEKQEVNRAGLTFRIKGPEAAEPLLRSAMDKYPKNAAVTFWLGELLLDRNDESGIPLVKEAMALDRSCRQDALSMLAEFYYKNDRMAELDALKEEAITHYAQTSVAEQASWHLTIKDNLVEPALTPEQLTAIQAILAPIKDLGVAYVVRRVLPGTGEHAYCLLVFPRKKLVESSNENQKLVSQVANIGAFPFRTKIFSPQNRKQWIKRLNKIPNAKVYERKK